jgi:hypothetical protein
MNAIVPVKAHAKKRPPSAADRWGACPGSSVAVQLYENEESDASTKGDFAHDWLETCVLFGIMEPDTGDEDVSTNLAIVMEWIGQQRAHYGPDCQVYAEQVFEIPETGEFGTGDITFVSPQVLHIADYKNGYVLVEHERNRQMLTYLLGAIAKYGARSEYWITVIQPNASHIEGPIRTYRVTYEDIAAWREIIKWSMANEHLFVAGKHCKKSYCPHRGNCLTFLQYAQTEAADAWFPADVNAMSDEQLAKALDHAEVLHGLRDELRKAAMMRIMQMDRNIAGYKCVKGRRDREFLEYGPVKNVLRDVFNVPEHKMHTQSPLTVKGVEDLIKAYARQNGLPRGGWSQVWDNYLAEHVRENTGGLTLERATDARPAHRRGSEFGALASPGQQYGNGERVFI